MSVDWPSYTIEEIAAELPNALSTGPFGSAISSKFFTDNGVPVIRGGNLSADVDTRLSDEGLVFVSPEKAKEFSRSIVRKGDLIFTCWGTINQVGFLDGRSKYAEYIISNKQMKLTPDPKKINPLFLYYVFSSPAKQAEILANGIGAAVPGFNLGQLKKHIVQLPPIEVQDKIASILGTIDGKIELNRQINQTLEQIAQTIFKSWFVDFEPVKAKIEAKAAGQDPERAAMCAISGKLEPELDQLPPEQYQQLAATAALFPDALVKSELGLIPEGWEVRPLDQIADYLNGLALQKFPPENDTDYLPVIKIAQLKKGDTEGADRASSKLKPEYIVNDGDVLFSWSGSLAVDVWCGGLGALNQHLFKVTSPDYPKWFYLFWTKFHLIDFQSIAADKAVTMGHIQRKHLTAALCVVPPALKVEKFDAFVAPLLAQQIELRKESRDLATLRDTLLPKLLSGELTVGNCEQQVEACA